MTSDYGTYRLTYTPPESTGNEDYPAIAIEMSTSGDANVEQMLRFYEAFLAASGYILKGDLVVNEPGINSWGLTAPITSTVQASLDRAAQRPGMRTNEVS